MRIYRDRLSCAVLALLLVPAVSRASSADAESASSVKDHPRVVEALGLLEIWLEWERANQRIPGVSMAVVHDQELVWAEGLGFADRESRRPAESDTLYSICSISKLFTSVALMKLHDEGRFRLSDPVGDLLPWFALDSKFEDSLPITVEAVLSHSAGLPRESAQPYWTGPDFPFPEREAIIEGLADQEVLYPASRYYQYSNLGLTLAGEIVQELSGRPYGDYVTEEVLEPLGLDDTTPYLPERERGGRFAAGYGPWPREGERVPMPFFQAKGITPAAGFASSAVDLARFASWQFRLLREGGQEILRASTLRDMQRVHWIDPDWKVSRGLGFGVWRNAEKTFVGHGGSCPGFRTQLALSPSDLVAVAFMANAMSVDTTTITNRAYDIVAPAIATALQGEEVAATTDPEWLRFAGLYRSVWGESAVIPWQGGLALLGLGGGNPMDNLEQLSHVEGPLFRRIREDGEMGEELRFIEDEQGRVTRMRVFGLYSEKVE